MGSAVDLDRPQSSGTGLFNRFSRRSKTLHPLYQMRHCQVTPGKRELRFDRDRFLELFDGKLDFISHQAIEMLKPPEICLGRALVEGDGHSIRH